MNTYFRNCILPTAIIPLATNPGIPAETPRARSRYTPVHRCPYSLASSFRRSSCAFSISRIRFSGTARLSAFESFSSISNSASSAACSEEKADAMRGRAASIASSAAGVVVSRMFESVPICVLSSRCAALATWNRGSYSPNRGSRSGRWSRGGRRIRGGYIWRSEERGDVCSVDGFGMRHAGGQVAPDHVVDGEQREAGCYCDGGS